MEACLWQLGFTQLCHKVSKNDFKVTEQLSLLLNSGEVLTRICFRAELDFILIGKQHSDLSSNFLNSGGGQVFLQHHIFHISLVHVRTTFKNGHRRPCWLLRVEKIWENPFSLRKWNIMGQNTLKINEGICQRVIRTCKKSTLIWKNFPIKKYRGEGFLAKNAVFFNFPWPPQEKFQMAANRTILMLEGLPMAHLNAHVPYFSKHPWKSS